MVVRNLGQPIRAADCELSFYNYEETNWRESPCFQLLANVTDHKPIVPIYFPASNTLSQFLNWPYLLKSFFAE